MAPNNEQNVNDFRPVVEENVRRIVGIAALRRIRRLIDEREEEMRLLRTRVVPMAAVALFVIAALIWILFNPWSGVAIDPCVTVEPAAVQEERREREWMKRFSVLPATLPISGRPAPGSCSW